MQGNLRKYGIRSQAYRRKIKENLNKVLENNVEIIDPDELHPDRLKYNYEQSKKMFMEYVQVSVEVDLVIAYVSEASMGTAIEMWEAYRSGVPILTVSSLSHHWVIKLLSYKIFPTLKNLFRFMNTKEFKSLLRVRNRKARFYELFDS